MNPFSLISIGCGLLLLPVLTVGSGGPSPSSGASAANRYVGVKVCKNCHADAANGDAYDRWAKGPHARAFETLASDAAKGIAAKLKIEDPQKSDQCLSCHVTAFGVDEKTGIKKGFKFEDGVQCESCHGPGEDHLKARMKAAMGGGGAAPVGADEIHAARDAAICTRCHNEKSPSFKEFCFKERMAAIEHLDPRKERTEKELEKLRETCTPDCPKCSKKDGDKDG